MIDELLVKSLASLQQNKIAKTEEIDEDGYFGQQIATTLRHFTPRQKAIATDSCRQSSVMSYFIVCKKQKGTDEDEGR